MGFAVVVVFSALCFLCTLRQTFTIMSILISCFHVIEILLEFDRRDAGMLGVMLAMIIMGCLLLAFPEEPKLELVEETAPAPSVLRGGRRKLKK